MYVLDKYGFHAMQHDDLCDDSQRDHNRTNTWLYIRMIGSSQDDMPVA
jgi:hypothetical protein